MSDVAPGGAYAGDRYQRRTITGDPTTTAHRALHRALEVGESGRHHRSVLEVGANRAEHLAHVRHGWDEYVMVDVGAMDPALRAGLPVGAAFVTGDAEALPFGAAAFDRTLMTCVLHHLRDPETALEELRRVTRPGGRISILLPTDPGLAYRLVRWATSGRRARRDGAADEERLAHAREHRNHYASLDLLARHVFRDDVVRPLHLPFLVPAWNLNLATVLRVDRR